MVSAVANDDLRPQRPGGLGRGAFLAVLVHVGLVVGLAFGVNWRSSEPTAVSAELWAQLPQEAAPPAEAPPPRVEPKPVPPKPKPPEPTPQELREAQIAVERAAREKKEREDKEREAREEKERAAREQQAKEEAEDKKRKELADKKRKEDDLRAAKERELARQENIKRMLGQAGATGAPESAGTAQQSAGPSASYAGRIVARIRPNIVLTDDVPGNPDAVVEVRAGPDGTIIGRRLVKSSGSKAWDDAVLRAIDRTDMLPRDTDGRVPSRIEIVFRPRG